MSPSVFTREDILAAKDTLIEPVKVPEWSPNDPEKVVFVRGLTGTDRDSFEMDMIESKAIGKGKTTQEINLRNLRAKLLVRTCVDTDDPDTAKLIFKIEDIEALGRKSGLALQRLYSVAQRLSGLSAEDVEELTAQLGEGQSDGSGSGSQDTLAILPSQPLSEPSAAESSASGSPSTDGSPLASVDSTSSSLS